MNESTERPTISRSFCAHEELHEGLVDVHVLPVHELVIPAGHRLVVAEPHHVPVFRMQVLAPEVRLVDPPPGRIPRMISAAGLT